MRRLCIVLCLIATPACDAKPVYCRKCEVGIVQDHPDERTRRTRRCVLNGREIDCTRVPGECPDCKE